MKKNYLQFTRRLDRIEETRVIGYILYKTFGYNSSESREILFDPREKRSLDIDRILQNPLFSANTCYVHCFHPKNSVFILNREEVASLLKEQIQPEFRSFDLDIIGRNIEDSDIISCTHDDFIFIYRNGTDNIPITNNTQDLNENQHQQSEWIWCFIERNSTVPTGIFSSFEQAKIWIFKHKIEGSLLKYPMNQPLNAQNWNPDNTQLSHQLSQEILDRNMEITYFKKDDKNIINCIQGNNIIQM